MMEPKQALSSQLKSSESSNNSNISSLQHNKKVQCQQVSVLQCTRPTCLKFSGTGRLIACGSADGHIALWSEQHWQQQPRNKTTTTTAPSSSFNETDHHAEQQSVRLKNGSANKRIRTAGHIGSSNKSLSKNSSSSSSSSSPAAILPDRRLRGHVLGVNDIAWTPEDRYLISASDDKTLRLWDVETGGLLKHFKGHRQAVYCCTINPQGNIILSGSNDYSYRLWDLRTGSCFQQFESHRDTITSVDFTRIDGSCFMTGSHDGICRIYDLLLGKCLRSIVHPFGEQNPPVAHARFSPNGRYLLASYLNNTIKLWDFTNLKAASVKTYKTADHNSQQQSADTADAVGKVRYSMPCTFVTAPDAEKSTNNTRNNNKPTTASASVADPDSSSSGRSTSLFSPGIMTSDDCYNQQHRTQWVVSGTEQGQLVWWDVQSQEIVHTMPCYADSDYTAENIIRQQCPRMPLAEIADTPSFTSIYAASDCSTIINSSGSKANTDVDRNSSRALLSASMLADAQKPVVIGLTLHPQHAPFIATALRFNPYIRVWRFS